MSDFLKQIVQPKYRIPLATALGFGIAGALYYYNRRPDKSIGMNFVLPGATIALGLNVIGWLMTDMGVFPVIARGNGDYEGMGNLSRDAVSFLSQINPEELYSNFKKHGLKIAPIPDNPSIVTQDED